MNKKDARNRKHKLANATNGNALTGQPNPLIADFAMLRVRAMQTPMLDPNFNEADVNVERHTKVIDYSSNYILAIIVLCVLRDKHGFAPKVPLSETFGEP